MGYHPEYHPDIKLQVEIEYKDDNATHRVYNMTGAEFNNFKPSPGSFVFDVWESNWNEADWLSK